MILPVGIVGIRWGMFRAFTGWFSRRPLSRIQKTLTTYVVGGGAVFAFWMAGAVAQEKPLAAVPEPAAPATSSASCLECHSDHTLTMRKQKREVPLFVDQAGLAKSAHSSLDCIDCHDGFDGDAMPHKKPMTTVDCASCHEDMAKKHVFHAKPAQAMQAVACTVCHGTLEITTLRSPEFPFAAKRQTEGCGSCHPGANSRFTVGSVHVSPDAANSKDKDSLILRIIADIYVWLIVLVVGAMSVHNFFDLFKKVRRKLKIHRGLIEEEHVAHRLYIRMTLHERLQHAALVISFVLLVVTGFIVALHLNCIVPL